MPPSRSATGSGYPSTRKIVWMRAARKLGKKSVRSMRRTTCRCTCGAMKLRIDRPRTKPCDAVCGGTLSRIRERICCCSFFKRVLGASMRRILPGLLRENAVVVMRQRRRIGSAGDILQIGKPLQFTDAQVQPLRQRSHRFDLRKLPARSWGDRTHRLRLGKPVLHGKFVAMLRPDFPKCLVLLKKPHHIAMPRAGRLQLANESLREWSQPTP